MAGGGRLLLKTGAGHQQWRLADERGDRRTACLTPIWQPGLSVTRSAYRRPQCKQDSPDHDYGLRRVHRP
jgi:hypothetical protein